MTEGKAVPHGGKLVSLMVADACERSALIAACEGRTIELSDRNACDVELLMVGGFSPLEGFMNQEEYESVVETMRLPSGLLFGLPVVMDTDDEAIKPGMKLLLQFEVRPSPSPRASHAHRWIYLVTTPPPSHTAMPCAHHHRASPSCVRRALRWL